VWVGISYHWADHIYTPQATLDLSTWTSDLTIVPNPAGLPAAPGGFEWVTSRFLSPTDSQPEAFIRLKLED
jgi:hypothetical protein